MGGYATLAGRRWPGYGGRAALALGWSDGGPRVAGLRRSGGGGRAPGEAAGRGGGSGQMSGKEAAAVWASGKEAATAVCAATVREI
jgi:hypothetical protein